MASIEERSRLIQSDEGTVNGSKTITFGLKTSRLVVTNDSSSKDLQVRAGSSNNQKITLKPTETVSLWFVAKNIILSGDNIPYRVWGFS